MSNTIGPSMNPEQYAGVVEQRFRNIEGQVGDLKTSLSGQIAAISAKIDERSKPQWQLMVSAIGVMMTILVALGALIYLPIKNDQTKTEFEINKLREQTISRVEYNTRHDAVVGAIDKLASVTNRIRETTMSRDELEQRFTTTGQRRDDFQHNTNLKVERLQKDLEANNGITVPRGELDKVWRGFEAKDGELQRQIDEMQRRFGDTFSLRDAITMMQRRIDTLESSPPAKR